MRSDVSGRRLNARGVVAAQVCDYSNGICCVWQSHRGYQIPVKLLNGDVQARLSESRQCPIPSRDLAPLPTPIDFDSKVSPNRALDSGLIEYGLQEPHDSRFPPRA